jgi:hypothetical protein
MIANSDRKIDSKTLSFSRENKTKALNNLLAIAFLRVVASNFVSVEDRKGDRLILVRFLK